MGKRETTTSIISRFIQVHGDRYSYDNVVYAGIDTDVIITCSLHGDFLQRPYIHLKGSNCPVCGHKSGGNKQKSNTVDFIQKSVIIHNNKYTYLKVNYQKAHKDVIITCPFHGDFLQTPTNHLSNHGCPVCGNIDIGVAHHSNTIEFIEKAVKVHGNKYNYLKVNYQSVQENVIITCPIHGDFTQTPSSHLSGTRCNLCGFQLNADNRRSNTNEFIIKAIEQHGILYNYSKVEYINALTNVIIICPIHGEFKQAPARHIRGSICPDCVSIGYSQMAITWIQYIENIDQILIQHAENGGEYKIPGTKYKVDGYCKETNTVYEFYGDRFHGNLKVFKPYELCHPYCNTSAIELYQKTIEREQKIKELGYNLISIWENDYNNINMEVQ